MGAGYIRTGRFPIISGTNSGPDVSGRTPVIFFERFLAGCALLSSAYGAPFRGLGLS